MVPIVKQLCPESRFSIKCPYTRAPRFIVVHNTANDAPAVNEVTYMINRGDEVSFHAAADDKEIRLGLPYDRNAWASGDGLGQGNMYGIHIEICYSLSGGERFIKAEQNAAEYIAGLLRQYGWGLDKVTKHQDYDGKYCPHRTLDLGWQRFKTMIKTFLEEGPELTESQVRAIVREEHNKLDPTYNTLDEVPGYWREDIAELVEKGAIAGVGGGRLGLTHSDCKAAVIAKRIREKM